MDNIQEIEKLAKQKQHIKTAFKGTLQITGIRSNLPTSSLFDEDWETFSNYLSSINKYLPGGEYFGNNLLNYHGTPISLVHNYSNQLTEEDFRNISPSAFSPLAYDTAIVACLTICKSKLRFPLHPASLEKRKIYSSLINLDFEGNSGKVQFYPNGDRKGFIMKLINFKYRKNSLSYEEGEKSEKYELFGV